MAEKPAGIAAEDPSAYDMPDFSALGAGPYPAILLEVVERASNGFVRWDQQVAHAGYCCRPIRIKGHVEEVDRATGEIRTVYSTEGEPDDTLLVACGTRRASKCASCSTWYQWDAFHLVRAGLRGGKGLAESVADHPKLFVTLTAPSFGAVHVRRTRASKVLACRPRDKAQRCTHGVELRCRVRHAEGDPALGTPICAKCVDYEAQVIWNALAPRLWGRFRTYLPRELASVMGMTQRQLAAAVRLRMVKVAEYQRRGVVHFHTIVRIDAAPPAGDPNVVAPPPAEFTIGLLEAAVRAARESAVIDCPELGVIGRSDTSVRWGAEVDVRVIRGGGPGELSNEAVAAYVAKYATKFSEALGLPQGPLDPHDDIGALAAPEHVKRLVWAAAVLGGRKELKALKLQEHAHGLGFGGHFLTKSRAYSTTMGELRAARRRHVRRQLAGEGEVLDAWGRPQDEQLVEVQGKWRYTGWGYLSLGEAWLASTAGARARERRQLAREELEGVWAA